MKIICHLEKFFLVIVALALGGCSAYHERIASYRSSYASGHTMAALEKIESLYESDGSTDTSYDAMVLSLEASQATRFAGIDSNDESYIRESQKHLQRVERLYNDYKAKGGASLFDYTASSLTVADAFPYLGTYGEAIMTAVYQMFTSMQLGEIDEARLYASRLYQRQQESVAANAGRITEARENLSSTSNANVNTAQYSSEMSEMRQKMLKSLPDTRGYELYVNPFAEYLIAFFHYYYGRGAEDYDIAQQCIRRVAGMNAQSDFLVQEVERFSTTSVATVEPTVYLVHEAGLAPSIEDESLVIPVVAGNTATLVSLAYPVLKADNDYCKNASLVTTNGTVFAEEICSVDAVFAKEFDDSYAARLTHAITVCLLKTAIVAGGQVATRDNAAALVGTMLFGNIYLVATNVADTRTCNSFPKSISMARTTMPKNRKVKVQLDGRSQKEVQLPVDGNVWIIYVRSFHRNAKPVITYFKVR